MSIKSVGRLQRGVIVEFDFSVLPGHQLLLEVCRERLATDGVQLDAPLMAHWMGGRSFSGGLHALCDKQEKKIEYSAVIADCNAQFKGRLKDSLNTIPHNFIAVVKRLLKKGIKVALVTRIDVEDVSAMFEDLLGGNFVVFHDVSNGFGFHTKDAWLRAARKIEIHERLCVALAASGYSVKGALNASMGVAAKVCEMTDHQDFSGSNIYFEEYKESLADQIIGYMRL